MRKAVNENRKAQVPRIRSVEKKETSVAQSARVQRAEREIVHIKGGFDRPFFIIVVLLLCFGSVMVFSASFAYAKAEYGDSYFFVRKQMIFALGGLFACLFTSHLDYFSKFIKRLMLFYFFAMLGLLVITPFIGMAEGEAVRWIYIGSFGFQPSEFMKPALVFVLAMYLSKYQKYIQDYSDFKMSSLYGTFYPYAIVGLVCALVALEKHISGTIIMFLIGTVVIFAAGGRKFWILMGGGVASLGAAFLIFVSGYGKTRINMWFHPETDPLGKGWQTLQGLTAIGSGGVLGLGLGNSLQKHMYVSQPQNDFIFSIVCEELGLVGALAVMALFLAFIWRGIVIALRAPDMYSSLLVIGIVGKVAIQAILNIAVVTNTLPNTGISLPFFSYGGSSLTVLMAEMGIVLSVSRYSSQEK